MLVEVQAAGVVLEGDLEVPAGARGVVLFARNVETRDERLVQPRESEVRAGGDDRDRTAPLAAHDRRVLVGETHQVGGDHVRPRLAGVEEQPVHRDVAAARRHEGKDVRGGHLARGRGADDSLRVIEDDGDQGPAFSGSRFRWRFAR